MTSISLTPDPANARVRILVSDSPGADLTRNGEVIRPGENVAGYKTVDDYEAPFGVPLTYEIDGQSATTQLDVSGAWITHPTLPDLALQVTVESDDEWEWRAPGTAHQIIGSEWPVVTFNTRTEHRGDLLIITPYSEQQAVRDLLVTGSPLLLRTPPACSVDDMWFWPETATRQKIGTPRTFTGLRWTLNYQRVQAPGGQVPRPFANSWDGVVASHTDWADVVGVYSTWDALIQTEHPHA